MLDNMRQRGALWREALRQRLTRTVAAWGTVTPPALLGVVAVQVLTLPVVAPPANNSSASETAQSLTCGSGLGILLSLVFALLTLALIVTGSYRIGNGIRKMSDPRSSKKQEGREEAVGGGIAWGGAMLMGSLPVVLGRLGLQTFSCINFGAL